MDNKSTMEGKRQKLLIRKLWRAAVDNKAGGEKERLNENLDGDICYMKNKFKA